MKHLRQYIRTILEASSLEETERSESYKLIRLFLSDYGTMQAIELADMLPDISPRIVELFSDIQSRVEEMIEFGRGNFPEEWKLGSGPEEVLMFVDYVSPFMESVRELRIIAQKEQEASARRDGWGSERVRKWGTVKLGKDFKRAMMAVNWVLAEEKTPEEMMNMPRGFGKTFVELAERFGIHL